MFTAMNLKASLDAICEVPVCKWQSYKDISLLTHILSFITPHNICNQFITARDGGSVKIHNGRHSMQRLTD